MKKVFLSISFVVFSFLFIQVICAQSTIKKQYTNIMHKGKLLTDDINSSALEGNLLGDSPIQMMKVYVPYNYDNFPENKYPVLYLLHGYTGTFATFYNYGELLEALDELIAEETINPLIVVTPNGKNKYDGSIYTDSYVTGNWETYIVHDIVEFIKGKYRVIDNVEATGLGGFSMGGCGAASIGMKNPSVFSSVATIGGVLDFSEMYLSDDWREHLIEAAEKGKYSSSDNWQVRYCYAQAVASAPDSSTLPLMGQLPYTANGAFVDSTWQKWMQYDPLSNIEKYKDSLLKLNALQIYVGSYDHIYSSSVNFHNELSKFDIEHGYQEYNSGHSFQPIRDELLEFFSDNLYKLVPDIKMLSNYHLEKTDTLFIEMDMDGEVVIVPFDTYPNTDSISDNNVATISANANEKKAIQLSEFAYGKHSVYAISNDGMVSNFPDHFFVVPNKTIPILNIGNTNVTRGDSIAVSSNKKGKICLVGPNAVVTDTLKTVYDILSSTRLVECKEVEADENVSFSTAGLSALPYWIYAFDEYELVSEYVVVDIIASTQEKERAFEFNLFPNPVKGILKIQVPYLNNYSVDIYSLNGELLYQYNKETILFSIDLSTLDKGLYLIKISSENYVATKKVIKM